MFRILKTELLKTIKTRRLLIFMAIMLFLSVFFGFVILQVAKTGVIPEEEVEKTIRGYFSIQILGVAADLILPVFSTLFVCFLIIDEYNGGTLKLPVLCGHSRESILLAKMSAVILMMGVLMLMTWISSTIVAVFLWGHHDVIPMTGTAFFIYAKTFFVIIAWTIVMFAFSLFIQNSGIMIAVMTVVLVLSSIAGSMFPQITKYFLTFYLKAFTNTSGNTVPGVLICTIHICVFGIAALLRFRKLEIQK